VTEPTDATMQAAVAGTFVALADLLGGLSPDVWDAPSLCEGWRVREVVAHVTMPARYTADEFMKLLADAGLDFPSLSNRLAAEDGRLALAVLDENLRAGALHRWTPPGGGWHGALNHAVIHGLDVTAAIGADRCSSDDAMRIVLDDLTAGGVHREFGTELSPVTLHATDLDWSFGTGPDLAGSAEDIALHLCGRGIRLGVPG